jgi:hypothetical protein
MCLPRGRSAQRSAGRREDTRKPWQGFGGCNWVPWNNSGSSLAHIVFRAPKQGRSGKPDAPIGRASMRVVRAYGPETPSSKKVPQIDRFTAELVIRRATANKRTKLRYFTRDQFRGHIDECRATLDAASLHNPFATSAWTKDERPIAGQLWLVFDRAGVHVRPGLLGSARQDVRWYRTERCADAARAGE